MKHGIFRLLFSSSCGFVLIDWWGLSGMDGGLVRMGFSTTRFGGEVLQGGNWRVCGLIFSIRMGWNIRCEN